jgi:hypothetical protein
MAWTAHKPADCLLEKQHKEEQNKPYKANSATVAAAATSAVNSQPPFCHPHGRYGQPGPEQMMVRASMQVLHVSRVHGQIIGDRARNCHSPFIPHHSDRDLPARLPRPSRRRHVALHLGQDTGQDGNMAPPGASSRCSSQEADQVFQETEEEND